MNRRNLYVLILATTVGTASAGWVMANKHTTAPLETSVEPRRPALAVAAATIAPQLGYQYRRTFTGRVEAARSSALGFEQAGRIAEVAVREGDRVQQGQILARLDTARLDAQRRELLAARDEAEASLSLARATLRRHDEIVERGGVSRQGLDEAREAFQATKARVKLARRQVDSIEVELDKARLLAPYDGIVIARRADEGRVLNTGSIVLELQEVARPEIRVGVAGRLVDDLHVGHTYPMSHGGDPFSARLRTVLPVRAVAGRTVDAIFEPVEPIAGLRSGDLVRLTLHEFVEQPGTWLPMSALTEAQRGLWSVYVTRPSDGTEPAGIDATHRLQRRLVDVVYQDTDRVYVRAALTPRDRVVVDGLQRVVPGQWVRDISAPTYLARTNEEVRHDG